MRLPLALTALLPLLPPVGASAQTARPHLDYEAAAAVRDGCLRMAASEGWHMAVSVYDEAGSLVTFAAMDDAIPAVTDVAQWKGRAAATFRLPTTTMREWNAPYIPNIATVGGGLPLFTEAGDPVGGVGASGASQEQDVACAEAGAAAAGLRTSRP